MDDQAPEDPLRQLLTHLTRRTGGQARTLAENADSSDVLVAPASALGRGMACPDRGYLIGRLPTVVRRPGVVSREGMLLGGERRHLYAAGWIRDGDDEQPVALYGPIPLPRRDDPPGSFTVLAIIAAYNEADVLGGIIRRMAEQGVDCYVIDNWSTDDTLEVAQSFLPHPVVGIERFPETDAGEHQWARMLRRKAQIAADIQPDWAIHHDADEYRQSPWPGVRLREALWHVGRSGYNAVDFTVVTHHPVDDRFSGGDVVSEMPWFSLGTKPGHFSQIKAWRCRGQVVDLAGSAGHRVSFDERRTYPLNFLLRHYPIRSQAHGQRKVHTERVPRIPDEPYEHGWHHQYDHVSDDHEFLRSTRELDYFDPVLFAERYLGERLARTGLQPRDA